MRRAILLALVTLVMPAAASAQAWPTRPVRLIVPFPAGGTADFMARLIAPSISEALGQQIVVDNRGGASGTIGTGAVAKAAPDGYSFLLTVDSHAVNPSLIPSMPYDTLAELAPVTLLAKAPLVLVAHPGVPANNLAELVALAKARPDSLNYASIGAGSLGHLGAVLLQQQLGITMTHVPYRGGAPAVSDLVAGQVQLMIITTLGSLSLIKAGQLKPVAITAAGRVAALPGTATVAEAGYPGFDVSSWFGLLTTAGTPTPIIDRMQAEVVKALARPDVKGKLDEQSLAIVGSTPAAFDGFIRAEIARWGKVIRDGNIKIE